MDMRDEEEKRTFSRFLNERKLALGFTDEVIADKIGCDLRTVTRYMKLHRDGEWMPKEIKDDIYRDFLSTLQASHEDFMSFRAAQVQVQTHDEPIVANSTIHISGGTFNKSPLFARNVTYHEHRVAGEDQDEGK